MDSSRIATWKVVAGALAVLSLVKVHSLHDPDLNRRVTQITLSQPFAMPFSSPNAYCLRHIDDPVMLCGMAAKMERDSGITLATLPACGFCFDASMWLAGIGKTDGQIARRTRELNQFAQGLQGG